MKGRDQTLFARKWFALLAVITTVLLGAWAAPSSASTGSAAPVTLGLLCSCSGAYGASVDTQVDVYKTAVNYVNAHGGINGHKIKIIEKDDAGTPATSATDVQELIADKVDAISDWSFVDAAWASTVGSSNIPIVGGNISDSTFNTYPDFYPQGQTLNSVTKSTVLAAKEAGAKSIGIIYCAEAPTCSQSAAEDKSIAQSLGVSVVYDAQASSTAPNYTAQCLAAQQAKAQSIILLYAPAVMVTIAGNCATQGYLPTYDAEGGAINFALSSTSAGLKNHLVGPFTDLPSISTAQSVKTMNAAIQKAYPGLEKSQAWTEESPTAWDSVLLLQAAAKAGGLTSSGTATAASITKGLNSMKGQTLGGMAPPLTFTAGKPHTVDCWYTAALVMGKASMTNGGKTTCSSS
jgi:branched-chain amino acid transport system substrate-binding protein